MDGGILGFLVLSHERDYVYEYYIFHSKVSNRVKEMKEEVYNFNLSVKKGARK